MKAVVLLFICIAITWAQQSKQDQTSDLQQSQSGQGQQSQSGQGQQSQSGQEQPYGENIDQRHPETKGQEQQFQQTYGENFDQGQQDQSQPYGDNFDQSQQQSQDQTKGQQQQSYSDNFDQSQQQSQEQQPNCQQAQQYGDDRGQQQNCQQAEQYSDNQDQQLNQNQRSRFQNQQQQCQNQNQPCQGQNIGQMGQQGLLNQQQYQRFSAADICSPLLENIFTGSGNAIQNAAASLLDARTQFIENGDNLRISDSVFEVLQNVDYMTTTVVSSIFEPHSKICSLKVILSFLPSNSRCVATTQICQRLRFNDQGRITLIDNVDRNDYQFMQCFSQLSQVS